ncbi:MAG: protease complex subunit PrcB family protein [Marinobacter sp.]|nr:protease complex subunit PrcB family protein [Marinobacter sp.]
MNRVLSGSLALLALLGAGGCASQGDMHGPLARQLTASDHCGLTAPGMLYLADKQELAKLANLPGQTMSLSSLAALDFSREHLVIVALGQKNTAGYGVTLSSARLDGDVLAMEMEVQAPPPGSMVAQVLTTPCAALAITSQGWSRLSATGEGLPAMSRER